MYNNRRDIYLMKTTNGKKNRGKYKEKWEGLEGKKETHTEWERDLKK